MDGSSGLAPGLGEFALLRFTCPGAEHRSAAGVRGKTASVPPIPLDVQACTASRERSTGTPLSHPRRRPALLAPATTHPVLVLNRKRLVRLQSAANGATASIGAVAGRLLLRLAKE